MTDLAGGMAATVPCPGCAAEVAIGEAVDNGFRCPACGTDLPERPDYAVDGATTAVEVVRAYGAYGYDGEFSAHGDAGEAGGDDGTTALERVDCPGCGMTHTLDDEVHLDARRPTDDAEVLALRCKHCGAAGTLVLPNEPVPPS